MEKEHGLSIWFFVGGILTIYGIIILIANIPAFFITCHNNTCYPGTIACRPLVGNFIDCIGSALSLPSLAGEAFHTG